jgi:hypothetical protein
MKKENDSVKYDSDEYRAFIADRREAAKRIDIETCELGRWYTCGADPYGVRDDLPEEMQQVGTNRFVRGSQNDGWVCEDELSTEQCRAMYARIEREWEQHTRGDWK